MVTAMAAYAGPQPYFPVKPDGGKLVYEVDSLGNRLLDYSSCGYRNSSESLPAVVNSVFVPWAEGDQSARIQRAIDYVSSLPADAQGRRGAVLLDKGTFTLGESLYITKSGVTLRGCGEAATTLIKTGVDRGALIYVEGVYNPVITDTVAITYTYVPVNSRNIAVASTESFSKGGGVFVKRPSTAEWIAAMKCDEFGGGISALGWKPGDATLMWDRTVTSVGADSITIDFPVTMALDSKWGESVVMTYTWPGRICEVGVEYLTLVSEYDNSNPKDEDHCWAGISVANATDCWVRKVDFRHFAGSAVILQPTASCVTVEDCRSTEPVSEIGGMRRSTFLTLGQNNLFQRCYSEHGIHDFSAGMYAPGPNAFVQCDAIESLGFSGASDAWAPGLLFDIVNVDGNNITFANLGQDKNGAGWNTGNSLLWQCTASEIECYTPMADTPNSAYGCWAQFSGDGYWGQSNNHVQPRSFFYAQLAERIDSVPQSQSRILPMETNATSSPTVEAAMQLAQEAYIPRLTLDKWIADAPAAVSFDPAGVAVIDVMKIKPKAESGKSAPVFDITDGVFVADGAAIVGGRQEVPWWNGKIKPNYTVKAKPHITRFVPGREGLGLTDRIDSTIATMHDAGIVVLDHNYGLWYERRRDDHERVRRQDGDVWAPFYEQPFARSGEGTAWDGLSKYDLTRPNAWYWSRLNDYASRGAEDGLLLFNQHYFQHNILEAGAHWVDCPWRSVNNINDTDFPEPVPFAGDKRIFVADMFYDVNHPVRRELHRNFIRMNLDQLADQPNVVHLISAEYTGPLHFTEFWLEVIDEWQKETGKDVKVALSTTKDVQDAILSNPKYDDVVDIIDIRYWHYNTDSIYAPEGGKNLAPRQHARKMKVGKVTFDEAYKAVSEYRTKYPGKAVTYYAQNYPDMAWAVFMGGGSLAGIPVSDSAFLSAAAKMKPMERTDATYVSLAGEKGSIVYPTESGAVSLTLAPGKYRVTSYDKTTGKQEVLSKSVKTDGTYTLDAKSGRIYWLNKL